MRPILTALAALLVIPALAAEGPAPGAAPRAAPKANALILEFLRAADADRDGLVSKAEAEAYVSRTRDAKRAEADKAWGELVGFLGLPAGTAEIAGKDYAAALSRMLKAADADGDGTVTAKERQAYLSAQPEGAARAIAADLLGNVDADGDGSVSPAEAKTAAETLTGAPPARLADVSKAAMGQAETERQLFALMVQSNGDPEGRIRIGDFDHAPGKD